MPNTDTKLLRDPMRQRGLSVGASETYRCHIYRHQTSLLQLY
jgi:hypothetical protein